MPTPLPRSNSYTVRFKVSVVEWQRKNKVSIHRTTQHFSIGWVGEGGRNRERKCRIPRISPPLLCFMLRLRLQKGGLFAGHYGVYSRMTVVILVCCCSTVVIHLQNLTFSVYHAPIVLSPKLATHLLYVNHTPIRIAAQWSLGISKSLHIINIHFSSGIRIRADFSKGKFTAPMRLALLMA